MFAFSGLLEQLLPLALTLQNSHWKCKTIDKYYIGKGLCK